MNGMRRVTRRAIALLATGMVALTGTAAAAETMNYDAGEVLVTQAAEASDSRFREMPVQVRGVVGVPDGAGPFPVAVVVHGSYPFCDVFGEYDVWPCPPENDLRQYEGFSYLAGALADAGYVALVPDLSAEFNTGFAAPAFGERAIQIIDAHLDAAVGDDAMAPALASKVDPERLVLAGHS